MRCLNPRVDRALYATGALARTILHATMTTRLARCVGYCVPVATSYLQQLEMSRISYSKRQLILILRQHEEYWENETNQRRMIMAKPICVFTEAEQTTIEAQMRVSSEALRIVKLITDGALARLEDECENADVDA